MPKRITLPPLGEHDDDWLRILAWLNNTSKSTQAANLISSQIKEKKAEIVEMVNYIASKRGITTDELIASILEGTADGNRESSEED